MMINKKNTWGQKLIRTVTSVFPVDKQRKGDCNRCGECCNLPTRCPFLGYDHEGLAICKAYKYRPLNCRKYPRSSDEQICPSCSYFFTDENRKAVK